MLRELTWYSPRPPRARSGLSPNTNGNLTISSRLCFDSRALPPIGAYLVQTRGNYSLRRGCNSISLSVTARPSTLTRISFTVWQPRAPFKGRCPPLVTDPLDHIPSSKQTHWTIFHDRKQQDTNAMAQLQVNNAIRLRYLTSILVLVIFAHRWDSHFPERFIQMCLLVVNNRMNF